MKTTVIGTLEAALMHVTYEDEELEKAVDSLLNKLDNDLFEIGYEASEDTSDAVGEVDLRLNELDDEDEKDEKDEDEDEIVEDDDEDEE